MDTHLMASALVLSCAMAVAPGEAQADDASRCVAAAQEGQTQRDAHKLVEARELFRACAATACPAVVSKDCGNWLEAVEESLPSVVLSAKDATGEYAVDVTVTVDGQPMAARLDGQAQALNPGMHVFRFTRPDGATAELRAPVREGVKNQPIAVTLATKSVAIASNREPAVQRVSPWQIVGAAAAGLGVVGVGLGVTFGLMSVSDKESANCDAAGYCDAGPLASARSHASASKVAFVAGAALLAGGVTLMVFAPGLGQPAPRASTSLRARADGIFVEGRW